MRTHHLDFYFFVLVKVGKIVLMTLLKIKEFLQRKISLKGFLPFTIFPASPTSNNNMKITLSSIKIFTPFVVNEIKYKKKITKKSIEM